MKIELAPTLAFYKDKVISARITFGDEYVANISPYKEIIELGDLKTETNKLLDENKGNEVVIWFIQCAFAEIMFKGTQLLDN